MQIELIKVSTIFMLDPNLTMLIEKLGQKKYVTAHVRQQPDGATIAFLEPPDVIAGKGSVRVTYNFGRRTLSVEGSISTEVCGALTDIEDCLKELRVEIEKALIPFEVTVVAETELKPKFTDSVYDCVHLLGFKLRLAEGGFIIDGGDPTSNNWFSVNLTPVWSSYAITERGCLYRIRITYRDETRKIFQFLQNLEDVLKRILEEV